MGRDLFVYGIESDRIIALNTQYNNIAKDEIVKTRKYILENINQRTHFLYEKYFDWHEHAQDNGIIEIFGYRSRAICYAICQIVDELQENSYKIFNSDNIYEYELERILSKAELLTILDYLIFLSYMQGRQKGEYKEEKINPDIENSIKHDLVRDIFPNKFFIGDEFEWFSWEYGRFCKWKDKVMETNYDYYWWVDS